jgi:hypothetical protein
MLRVPDNYQITPNSHHCCDQIRLSRGITAARTIIVRKSHGSLKLSSHDSCHGILHTFPLELEMGKYVLKLG